MNLVDANLLLYAYDERSALHAPAKAWITAEFRSPSLTALAYATLLAFVRVSTNARIMAVPFDIERACSIVDEWLSLPSVRLLTPTDRHWKTFSTVAVASQARGPLAPDADLAATAIEHGATVCTHDRDFSRFAGLRVNYPLAERP